MKGGQSNPHGNVSVEGEAAMEVDWLTISEDLMPVKIVRGKAPCESILDFTEAKDREIDWGFSLESHRRAA